MEEEEVLVGSFRRGVHGAATIVCEVGGEPAGSPSASSCFKGVPIAEMSIDDDDDKDDDVSSFLVREDPGDEEEEASADNSKPVVCEGVSASSCASSCSSSKGAWFSLSTAAVGEPVEGGAVASALTVAKSLPTMTSCERDESGRLVDFPRMEQLAASGDESRDFSWWCWWLLPLL